MQTLNCLVIEDEPIAARIINLYAEKVPFLEIKAVCTDAFAASEILKQIKIDVIFLDIHLPKIKGTDFLRSLTHSIQVIITSAYDQYAMEGYELEITDYLLKPFSFARFLRAVNRLRSDEVTQRAGAREFRFFNVNKKMTRIYLDEILYVESLKEYVRIYLREGSLVTKFQLGAIEKFLDSRGFLRVHRCYLVARAEVRSFSYNAVEVNGKHLPVGRSYVNTVKRELGKDS